MYAGTHSETNLMSTKKTWYSASVNVDQTAIDAAEFGLNEAGAYGTEVDLLGNRSRQAETVVKGYFSERPDIDHLRETLKSGLAIYDLSEDLIKDVVIDTVEDEDWLAEWKKHWKPTEIGKFIIAPPWETVDPHDKIVIRIEPNMAFGTGTHDTTKLCLKATGELYETGQTVLDVGTGTGILAIAAAKLGAKTIFACDTDVDSVNIARENAILNETGWIDFAEGPLAADAPIFDFVFANLTIDVIVPILDLLLSKARTTLVLSGILVEQKPVIEEALRKFQISHLKSEISGEWISVVIRQNRDR